MQMNHNEVSKGDDMGNQSQEQLLRHGPNGSDKSQSQMEMV